MPVLRPHDKGLSTALAAVFLLTAFLLGARPAAAQETERLWEALRAGSAVAIMRHALAPGTGDPANLTIGDCTTQRNLSAEGRRQAAETGDRFRANGITQARVFSSAWCRCQDTATLMQLGPVETLTPLNSFFRNFERREPQTDALKEWLAEQKAGAPLLLVTHQVNISALTGTHTRSGEIVVVRREIDGAMTVLGSL